MNWGYWSSGGQEEARGLILPRRSVLRWPPSVRLSGMTNFLKKTLQTLALVLASFYSASGHAQTSGTKLIHDCAAAVRSLDGNQADTVDELSSASKCIGMVEGVEGTLIILEGVARQRHSSLSDTACFPEGFSTAQAIRISYKYMQDHPDQLNGAGSGLIFLALTKSFPCGAR